MLFRQNKKRRHAVELTAMIDVTFMLLIFLLVTTRFSDLTWLDVQLPQALGGAESQSDAPLNVLVDRHGRTWVQGAQVRGGAAPLMRAILDASAGSRERPVRVQGDARVDYGRIVAVMDAVTRLGFRRVSLAVEAEQGGGQGGG